MTSWQIRNEAFTVHATAFDNTKQRCTMFQCHWCAGGGDGITVRLAGRAWLPHDLEIMGSIPDPSVFIGNP